LDVISQIYALPNIKRYMETRLELWAVTVIAKKLYKWE
jgi:hypothetical protein